MNARARIGATAALLGFAVVVSGCTGADEAQAPPEAQPTTLDVGLVLEPTDLDIRRTSGIALEQILIDNVYEGLVSRTQDGEIVDTLAASHEVSEDGRTYTFTLNDGIRFHDGAPATAADAARSIQEVMDDESFVGHADLDAVDRVEAPDDATVVLSLSRPDSQLLWNLGGRAGLVLPPSENLDLADTALGTGPYRLQDWRQGDSVTLARFDDYWGQAATIDEVAFSYIPDPAAAVNAVLAGDVDVQTSVDPMLAPQLEAADGIEVVEGRTTDTFVLAFNNRVEPFDDPAVRRAIRQAIDHEALIAAIGAGEPLGGPVPELDPGYEDLTGLRPYDQEESRRLLAEAGADGLELTLTIPNHYPETIGTVLTTQLADVGIELTVQSVEFATWLNDVYTNHAYELSVVDHAEARDLGNWANPGYYFGFDDPAVQDRYADARAATDPAAADEALRDTARLVSEADAGDWLYTATAVTAVRDGVDGFPTDSTTARLDLGGVTVDE